VPVISPNEDGTVPELPFAAKEGTLIHSGEYDGLSVPAAQKVLGEWLEANGIGERKVQYRLRDWLISRQRYWGCPIPILHTKEGEMQTVPTAALPVELPDVEHYEPSGDGTSPLAHIEEFMNATDRDGRLARRESDTMGGFACSSWYFLRFCDPHNERAAFDPKRVNYWMPVDCYVGGAEHAVMHLLYARFWTKVLHDAGLVDVKEPFQRLQNQGQVLALTPYRRAQADERLEVGEEGVRISFAEAKGMDPDEVTWRWARMSKSKGNVVTPDEMVESYGADALRVYLLFVAPFSTDIEWKNEGVESAARFLSRVFKLIEGIRPGFEPGWRGGLAITELDEAARGIRRLTHQTIANCTADIERFSFNTYISWLMKYLNGLNDALPVDESTPVDVRLALSEAAETFVKLLSPAAPHSADELWESLGFEGFTFDAAWPVSDPELAAVEMLTIAVQVNGKLRDTFSVAPDAVKEEYEKRALGCDKVQPHLAGKSVRKVIVVPGKLVNLVVSES
ncbi:MAG: class I tRNA ligase family protein, partial [Fimbriimonadaceae bacterium]|nr:class I tRNA ligase family protein [Fimbriimonadaceae bacterium]